MPTRRAAERWAKMAKDARAIAAQTPDPASQRTMLNIAAEYDKLAEREAELARMKGGRRGGDPGRK